MRNEKYSFPSKMKKSEIFRYLPHLLYYLIVHCWTFMFEITMFICCLPWARHCSKFFTCINSIFTTSLYVGCHYYSNLQMRKPKHRKMEWLIQKYMCVGCPLDWPQVWWFAGMTHRTQHVVIFKVMIYYREKVQSKWAKGKGEFKGKQGTSLQESSPS